eukprot:COSAG02_NODE_1466_length_12483_cov_37.157703_7_plen_90_part_00
MLMSDAANLCMVTAFVNHDPPRCVAYFDVGKEPAAKTIPYVSAAPSALTLKAAAVVYIPCMGHVFLKSVQLVPSLYPCGKFNLSNQHAS